MRGTRSLGVALIAAAVTTTPALAQHQNGAAPSLSVPAKSAPAPAANMAATATTPPNAPMANNQTTAANAPMANNQSTATSAPMANDQTTAANAKGTSGSLEKYNGDWRTSKLVGATVFDSNGDSIGSIDDLLMDDSGKISQAVISTGGGVLGIGGKLVEVPFDQLKLEPSATNNGALTTAAPPTTPPGSNGSVRTMPAANPGPSHPTYYSVVLPGATKDSLAQQQTFKYASTD